MSPEELARYNQYWDNAGNQLAKNSAVQYRNEILNGNITKTTGGKINSKVATVAVDTYDGHVSYGISGMKNNPTRNPVNSTMNDILSNQGQSYTNYPLDNCGEFNAINYSLNSGGNITDLKVYSIDIKSGNVKTPCLNCQVMYGGLVDFVQ